MKIVILTHPRTSRQIEAPATSVEHYVANGWRPATPDAPKGNASRDEWVSFARSQGFSEVEVEGKSRDELRAALS